MEQFNLEKWLQDKSRKICTRDGREVTIEKTDIHIHGMSHMILGKYSDIYEMWHSNGRINYTDSDCNLDLFFADEEEELNEFEKVVDNIINYPHFQDEQAVKQFSKTLLDLARKELEPELDKKLKESYNQGGLDTQEEITKCLPKWKKIPHGISRKELLDMMHKHIVLAFNDCVDYYYLDESDLRKLPKEE